eukprot:240626_1
MCGHVLDTFKGTYGPERLRGSDPDCCEWRERNQKPTKAKNPNSQNGRMDVFGSGSNGSVIWVTIGVIIAVIVCIVIGCKCGVCGAFQRNKHSTKDSPPDAEAPDHDMNEMDQLKSCSFGKGSAIDVDTQGRAVHVSEGAD